MKNGFRNDYEKSRLVPSKKGILIICRDYKAHACKVLVHPLPTDKYGCEDSQHCFNNHDYLCSWAGIEAISNVAGIAIPPETGMATNIDPDDTQRTNNGVIVGLGALCLGLSPCHPKSNPKRRREEEVGGRCLMKTLSS
ncbi:MAG: hypothetical protein CM15mP71_4240 [Candidatus Poseidoniales archaeon]|nr:MAG: hypothetical protein CM15mP71_4240 [Candidatus Poseidoniales archaeon]